MNLTIEKEKLAQLLYLSNSIVEKRNTMPIIANVKLSAEKSTLQVVSTNLEVNFLGEAECEVKQPGSTTLDARVFYDIVRELPNQPINLVLGKSHRLEMTCGQSTFRINGISGDEFPEINGTQLRSPVGIDIALLKEMLDQCSFAISTDETRYNINGVLVEFHQEAKRSLMRVVATDGHRLALVDREVASVTGLTDSVIIPRKGIYELRKVLETTEGTAEIEISEGFFSAQVGTIRLGVRLLDGRFPEYREVLPKEKKTSVLIDREALLSAVRRVSIVTTDKNRGVQFQVAGESITVTSSSPEHGEAKESVPCDKEGEDVSIGFSSRYVADILNALQSSESIRVEFNGEFGAGVFRAADHDDTVCVVMPMRFQ